MITELLGLAGSGILGSIVGMVSDAMQGRREARLKEIELESLRRAKENGQSASYLGSSSGFVTRPAFSIAFVLLTATYCTCALLCLCWPSATLLTFDPDAEPSKFSFLWGFFEWSRQSTKVYEISSGGVGYALLHPIAFQIGSVITGINPIGRK